MYCFRDFGTILLCTWGFSLLNIIIMFPEHATQQWIELGLSWSSSRRSVSTNIIPHMTVVNKNLFIKIRINVVESLDKNIIVLESCNIESVDMNLLLSRQNEAVSVSFIQFYIRRFVLSFIHFSISGSIRPFTYRYPCRQLIAITDAQGTQIHTKQSITLYISY